MKIELDYEKSAEENAAHYFEQSKLARKKVAGLKTAIKEITEKRKKKEKKAEEKKEAEKRDFERKRTKKWFEKYRWFVSTDGFLVIGGRDAHSNDEIVKKRMSMKDSYFHADVYGAPHCVVESEDKKIPEATMKEAAQFAVTFSKAWQEGRAYADAYSARPDQVSKNAPTGESLGTGAYMIYGEREWYRKVPVACAIGFNEKEGALMAGPPSAVKASCSSPIELKQGGKKKSDLAKQLKALLEKKGIRAALDDIIALLPNGESSLK